MPGLQQECNTGCEWSLFCVSYRIKLSLLLEGVLWEPDSLGCFISIASAKIKGFTPFSSPVPLPRAESSSGWAFWGTKWRIQGSLGRPYDRWGSRHTHTDWLPTGHSKWWQHRSMWDSGWARYSRLQRLFPVPLNLIPNWLLVLRPAAQPTSSSTWAPVSFWCLERPVTSYRRKSSVAQFLLKTSS